MITLLHIHHCFKFLFVSTAGVIIGFPVGEALTVTEGIDGDIMMCPEILEGVLERDVSVFASTLDVTATGNVYAN